MTSAGTFVPPPPPPSGRPTTTAYPAPTRAGVSAQPVALLPVRKERPLVTSTELVGLAIVGLAGNFALRTGIASLAGAVAVLFVGTLLLGTGRLERREAKLLVVGAMVLAPWLVIRNAPGLTFVTVLAIVTLFTLASSFSSRSRLTDASVLALFIHLISPLTEWMYGLAMVRRFVAAQRSTNGRGTALARGVLLAIPVVAVFAALLASADEVFKSIISVDGLPNVVGHLILATGVAVAALGFLSRSAHATETSTVRLTRVFSSIEIRIVLGSTLILFAGFVATQVAVAANGVNHVLETAGVTQAEHARNGFFQLLWVAGLTLVLLGAIRGLRKRDADQAKDPFTLLAVSIIALTLVITAISIQRLLYYVGAFGLTPLRLWALVGAVWVGLLLFAYGVAIGVRGRGADRDGEFGPATATMWFPTFVVLSAIAVVFALNVANPDGVVAWYNLEHHDADPDTYALSMLSDDAIRSIESGLDQTTPSAARDVVAQVCNRRPEIGSYGFLDWNWAEHGFDSFFAKRCVSNQ